MHRQLLAKGKGLRARAGMVSLATRVGPLTNCRVERRARRLPSLPAAQRLISTSSISPALCTPQAHDHMNPHMVGVNR